ncbi:MAG: hypothetical protein LQ342_005991 [Letrouitia transgressa]|nr:MAG: hypothetical protein LQ342_005991 [Letrouitia transgressa]
MGWWPWSSKSTNDGDPFRDLDPSLRDFLAKESPLKYNPPPTPKPPPSTHNEPTTTPPDQSSPALSQSLFPDGRYAHLWKNYRAKGEIDAEFKNDQDRLNDVLDAYKARKSLIGRAALENCTGEQIALFDCYARGTWTERSTLCRTKSKAFERCYEMQAVWSLHLPKPQPSTQPQSSNKQLTWKQILNLQRFLKALGYLSNPSRPAAIEEEIQMHADTLYHRMLAEERAVAAAKTAGESIPSFPSLFPSQKPATIGSPAAPVPPFSQQPRQQPQPQPQQQQQDQEPGTPEADIAALLAQLKPEARKGFEKRWKDKPVAEQAVEARALAAELKATMGTGKQVQDMMLETKRGREERRAKGTASIGDTISGWFGW